MASRLSCRREPRPRRMPRRGGNNVPAPSDLADAHPQTKSLADEVHPVAGRLDPLGHGGADGVRLRHPAGGSGPVDRGDGRSPRSLRPSSALTDCGADIVSSRAIVTSGRTRDGERPRRDALSGACNKVRPPIRDDPRPCSWSARPPRHRARSSGSGAKPPAWGAELAPPEALGVAIPDGGARSGLLPSRLDRRQVGVEGPRPTAPRKIPASRSHPAADRYTDARGGIAPPCPRRRRDIPRRTPP